MLKKIIEKIKLSKKRKNEEKELKKFKKISAEVIKLEEIFNNGELDAKKIKKYRSLKEEMKTMASKFIMKDGKLVRNSEESKIEDNKVEQVKPVAPVEQVAQAKAEVVENQKVEPEQKSQNIYENIKKEDEDFNSQVALAREKEMQRQQEFIQQQEMMRQQQMQQQEMMRQQQMQEQAQQQEMMRQQQMQEQEMIRQQMNRATASQQQMNQNVQQEIQPQPTRNSQEEEILREQLDNQRRMNLSSMYTQSEEPQEKIIKVVVSIQDSLDIETKLKFSQYDAFTNQLLKAMEEKLPFSIPPYVINGHKIIAFRVEELE